MDNIPSAARSAQMRLIGAKGSKAEVALRSWAHRLGYRFRIHARDVPGTPDLVIRKHRKAIFLHGCFWHRHDCPAGRRLPKTNLDFWRPKLIRNQERDREVTERLAEAGWNSLTIWECEMKNKSRVEDKLKGFLDA